MQRVIVRDLAPHTEYRFRVRAVSQEGVEGRWAVSLTSIKTGAVGKSGLASGPGSPPRSTARGKRPHVPATPPTQQPPRHRQRAEGNGPVAPLEPNSTASGARETTASSAGAPAPGAPPGSVVYPDGLPPGFTKERKPSATGKHVTTYRPPNGPDGERRPKVQSIPAAWRSHWETCGVEPPTAMPADATSAAPAAAPAPAAPAAAAPAPDAPALAAPAAAAAAATPAAAPAAASAPAAAAPAASSAGPSSDPAAANAPARAPAVGVPDAASEEAKLDKLRALHEAGLISQEVYVAKQQEVLARMGI